MSTMPDLIVPTATRRIVTIPHSAFTQQVKMIPLTCSVCGAPMKTRFKCEYCDTVYVSDIPSVYVPDQHKPEYWKELLDASRKFKDMGLISS